jgi:hypothetical protein
MTSDCPSCRSSQTRVIETRVLHNGGRRRRHHCHVCSHRWSSWCGDRPRIGRAPNAKKGRRTRPPLTQEEVRLALTSPLSAVQLARELKCSTETVAAIRRGAMHATVLPELPRRQAQQQQRSALSCLACSHWRRASCGMGFPDPLDEGPGFAADCSLYEPRSQSINTA